MLFNSSAFGVFLVLVCVGYWSLARRRRARLGLLLLASIYFYACWDVRFLALIGGVTVLDYLAARLLARVRNAAARLYLVAVTIGLNLGLLAFWKYTQLLLDALSPLLGLWGVRPVEVGSIVLPVGISFFTFQGLSYVIDCYRGEIEAERSLWRFALYITFFPQLVAGPIVRARDLLHQLDRPVVVDGRRFGRGLGLILVGLVKKVLLADYLAANLVDRVFDLPTHFGSLEVLVAIYGYSLQIYGDFCGYSDIAIGSALLLGYELPANFAAPYQADGLRDFWRRWHISLSTWLRDYLYRPLGGSRLGRWRTHVNLLVTMLLGGLWHGASASFLVWGGLHGVGLVATRAHEQRPRGRRWPRWVRVLVTFHVVTLLWVPFRADTFAGAWAVLVQLVSRAPGVTNLTLPVLALVLFGYLAHFCPARWEQWLLGVFERAPAYAQAAALVELLYLLRAVAGSQPAPFIYFQF